MIKNAKDDAEAMVSEVKTTVDIPSLSPGETVTITVVFKDKNGNTVATEPVGYHFAKRKLNFTLKLNYCL